MSSLGHLDPLVEEREKFLKYTHGDKIVIPFEKFIHDMMEVFWKKMMRICVNGSYGAIYFLGDKDLSFSSIQVHGTMDYGNSSRVMDTKNIVSISKSNSGDFDSSTIFYPECFMPGMLTNLSPEIHARFTDESKNSFYFLFSVTFVRYEPGNGNVNFTKYAFVKIPPGEITVETLSDKIMGFLPSIGVDTSDPKDGSFSLTVTMRDFFAILKFNDKMTISTEME